MVKIKNHNKRRVWPKLILLAIIGFAIWHSLNPYYISDWLASRRFKPSSEITELTTNLNLTKLAQQVFYASAPSLNGAEDFNTNCPRQESNFSILGCYDNQQIYLFRVQNPEVKNVEKVTAAHELLHAIYRRLSPSEKEKVNQLLTAEYAKLSQDEVFKKRMDYYSRTEPGEANNELHSIIGTEVAQISPELEQYYQQYFIDRAKIVQLYQAYIDQFNRLHEEAKRLEQEINRLNKIIVDLTKTYEQKLSVLNRDISNFNHRNQNNQFRSESEFYAERRQLVNRSNTLNKLRLQINDYVSQYNHHVKLYNQNATQTNKLNNSLDSLKSSDLNLD